ncbi:glycosyltransferase family 2 protein [Candidatus Daviesbacteria bacterium]|nr:glycosyltransferase family 2 protein [Candidatus Daviesbacteria bacterium]
MTNLKTPELSIIILNYNVKDLLLKCLDSIFQSKDKLDRWQVIVVDNASSDGSVEAVKGKYRVIGIDSRLRPLRGAGGNDRGKGRFWTNQNDKNGAQYDKEEIKSDRVVQLIENKENLGFSAGNNVGVKFAKAPVVLFLNPDTIIVDHAIQKSLEKLLSDPDIGALTCRVELPDGRLDYSCHRGFPTPWNSFAYFSGLSKIFPKSSLFSGYTASYLDINKAHEIDSLTGAFLMVRKIAGEQIRWWNTDYFWNGEDIEFCYSLKEKSWKIYYYPEVKIIHYKGSSSGLWTTALTTVPKETKLETAIYGVTAMKIFYKKHYYKKYPPLFRDFVLGGIKLLENYRKLRIKTKA